MRSTHPRNPRNGLGGALLLGLLAALGVLVIVLGRSIIPRTVMTSGTTAPTFDPYPIVPTWTPGPTSDVPTAVIASGIRPYPIPPTETPVILPAASPMPTPLPSDPILVHGSGLIDTIEPGELAKRVPLVVVAHVIKVHPSLWTTPDGSRPENPHSLDNTYTIYTPVEVSVEEFVKGTYHTEQIMLWVTGGSVGQDSITSDPPNNVYKEGERVLLLLDPNYHKLPSQEAPFVTVSFRYTISPDGKLMDFPEDLAPSLDEAIRAIKAGSP